MKGLKTGGRQAGTPNKDKKELVELLEEKYPGYHPVIALADIANNEGNDLALRYLANKEVAKYVCPQLKSVHHYTPENEDFDMYNLTDEQLRKLTLIQNQIEDIIK